MTNEEFRAKAKKIIDTEFNDYSNINRMHVAQVNCWGNIDNAMSYIDFIDKLYEQIKRDLK